MTLSAKMQEALNDQLNHELYSAYLYLAMAAYLEETDLPGCAHWMRMQAQEELLHGMKVYDYILSRDGRVMLATVQGPATEWASLTAAFDAALKHEQVMTGRFNELADLASGEKDHATMNVVRWFIDEQVEEEATLKEIMQKLRLFGGEGAGLYMFDRELATRPTPTLAPPA
jgi:ferritin